MGQHVSSLNDLTGNVTATDVFASVPSGANTHFGIATLTAGTVTVNNTNVTDDSVIFIGFKGDDSGTEGHLRVSAVVDGTSFTVTSSEATDNRPFGWLILNPAS